MNLTQSLLTACCTLGLAAPPVWGQAPAQPQPPASPMTPDVRSDVSKRKAIEPATSKLVASTGPAAPANSDAENPTVEPGKVKWHKTFEEAKAASEKSGKPVLLFQMMGRLDQQFC
ncbi:MAG TPA: hypothetical protein VKE74_24865 [Gemmataceae bacterium]|nr:hypothetical protein [Gemmataceae bacterium]